MDRLGKNVSVCFVEVVKKLPVHQPPLTVRVLAFCKTQLHQRMSVVHAPRQNLKERVAPPTMRFHKAFSNDVVI